MKKFYCSTVRGDYLTVIEDEGVLVSVHERYDGPHDVWLSRKDTLRLARHLIKLVEKMDD